MNEMSKQMAKYFKEKTEYKRLINGIKSKYINLGEIRGNVLIKNPDKAEAQALSGLMKKDYSKNKNIYNSNMLYGKNTVSTKYRRTCRDLL